MKCDDCNEGMSGPTSDWWGWSCPNCGFSKPLYEHLRDYAPGCLPEWKTDRHIRDKNNESQHDNRGGLN